MIINTMNITKHMRNSYKIKTNDKFGRFTVISEAEPRLYERTLSDGTVIKNKIRQWLCCCECGAKKIILQNNLIARKRATISCGCAKGGPKSSKWRGYEEISGGFWWTVKKNAQNRHIDFNITIEEMWDLFIKQERKCALSGLPLKFSSSSRARDGNASIDRIDSNLGYSINNVQWVDKQVNEMKLNLDEKTLIEFCHLVADYNTGNNN
jgi:hypothetical protein